MIELVDTHCHIHEQSYKLPKDQAYLRAKASGVTRLICVGTDVASSREAVEYASNTQNVWATVALHPHDAKLGVDALDQIRALLPSKSIVGIGECGLDYYYNYSDKKDQITALEYHMQLAQDFDLAMSFHVRDAFTDFWPVFDSFSGLRGVVHSFTATTTELEQCLDRGLFIGLNGIMTFTKDHVQLEAAKAVPLNKLLLETDAPFLTPAPVRGTINEPRNVSLTAEFLARLRGEDLATLATATTHNACQLFGIS